MIQRYSLDQILEKGLLSLYENWDDLPRKSTKRYLKRLCEQLADQFDEDVTDLSIREGLILDFWKEARLLPKVRECAKDSFDHLDKWAESKAMARGVRPGMRSFALIQVPDSDFSADRLHLLATLLRDDEPLFYVNIPYKVYQLSETVEVISKKLQQQISFGLLPREISPQVERLLQEHTLKEPEATTYRERCQLYVQTIHALNQIAQVQSAIQGALEPYRKVKTHRSFETSDGNTVIQSPDGGSKGMTNVNLEMTNVKFFTDVQFPSAVKRHEVTPLIVQLTLGKPKNSQVENEIIVKFPDPTKPELLDIVVNASGFSEVTTIWSRKIEVYRTQSSQPAIFLLKADKEGTQRITIDFYHKGKQLSSGSFEVNIYSGMSQSTSTTKHEFPQELHFPQSSTPPPDLELRITKGGDESKLYFMLHSTDAEVGYHWKKMGDIELVVDNPQTFLEHKFQQMSEFAAKPTDQSIDKMQDMGVELFEELLPKELQEAYWKHIQPLLKKGTIQSFLITSDEPWIPWELIKPYRYDDEKDEEEQGGFWAEDFQIARWLAGNGPADRIGIGVVQIVAPELNLHYVLQEKIYFDNLAALGVGVEQPLKSKCDVIKRATNGGVEILHFSTHGSFDTENPNHSIISLTDGALTPTDLSTRKIKGLQRSKPLVFLNACHTSRIGTGLTGLGGWAEIFVAKIGASAFIGSLWEVNDQLAAEFAIKFYDELQAEKTLGEAFHSARMTIKERQPGNSTWLAYTLYGNPNSIVTWPLIAALEVEIKAKVEEEQIP